MQTYTITQNRLLGRVFLGLFGTLLTALVGVLVGTQLPIGLIPVLSLVELGMIVYAMFRQRTRAIGFPFVYLFTFISGITLWPIISYYAIGLGVGIVIKALAVTAVHFSWLRLSHHVRRWIFHSLADFCSSACWLCS
ncbi:hypothetical protein GCM10025858_23700 [Alicyclobacillus sacchari]|nr:Bax inhibitor-1 family protein [Alicyclobacillus sacchari]GMA57867.1 hypothetical protein GCM10025858_23700 [Alicyclobacillus sacchari]